MKLTNIQIDGEFIKKLYKKIVRYQPWHDEDTKHNSINSKLGCIPSSYAEFHKQFHKFDIIFKILISLIKNQILQLQV